MPAVDPAPRQRDYTRTRRNLLDAARVEVHQRGVGVSLDAIAQRAGVSKGGLLHHFPSKDDLFVALATDLYSHFEQRVHSFVAADSGTADSGTADSPPGAAAAPPGRLVRSFVRATFAELERSDLASQHGALLTLMSRVPSVSALINEKLQNWQQLLVDDHTPPAVVRLVMLACDGAAVAMLLNPAHQGRQLAEIEQNLLALIEAGDTLTDLLEPTRPAKDHS